MPTINELKDIARENSIRGFSKYTKKQDLIDFLTSQGIEIEKEQKQNKKEKIQTNIKKMETVELENLKLEKGYELYDYQKEVVEWMKNNPINYGINGGILHLDMGLGKTLISLAYISTTNTKFPALVIMSKTLMYEWKVNIEKFFDDKLKCFYMHKDFTSLKDIENFDRETLLKYNVILTTYDVCLQVVKKDKNILNNVLVKGEGLLKNKVVNVKPRGYVDKENIKGYKTLYYTPWDIIICDESQRFSTYTTQTYRSMMGLYSETKWCLSGTPIRNNTKELYTQLTFCGYNGTENHLSWVYDDVKLFNQHELYNNIYVLKYSDTNIVLPEKVDMFYNISMNKQQLFVYKIILSIVQSKYNDMLHKLCNFTDVLAMFFRLRQSVVAPYLLTRNAKIEKQLENVDLLKWLKNKDGEAGIYSPKINKIIDILNNIENNEKTIIFSMYTSNLELLGYALEKRTDKKYIMIDGSINGNKRYELLNKFRNDDANVLLINYKIGSEGLNLVEANHCIFIEPWWNNAIHNQAKSRCWRIGQTKKVFTHQLITENSIELEIIILCINKDKIADGILNGRDYDKVNTGLTINNLCKIIFGS